MWLNSKLEQPSQPLQPLSRPRLHALLDRWPDYRLVLVRAAAGYGKTSLVSIWATATHHPIAWLSLDRSDGDPVLFMRYLAAAIDRVVPGAINTVEPVLRDLQPDPMAALSVLLSALEPGGLLGTQAMSGPFLLVLDDYHRVQSTAVDELIEFALQRAPARFHFMILTRDLPSFSVARLLVAGDVLELTANDLRFDEDEISRFLKALHLPELATAQRAQILEQSEGWVAGLKMAGLSLADEADPTQFVEQLHGSSHWQAEYLTGEVLGHQSPEMRRFLLETSILNQFSSKLCVAVTGQPNAAKLLSDGYTAGLFLIPLDNRRAWYRYHHLFQEMLQLRLAESHSQAEITELHRRAATWLEAEADRAEAVEHYLAAGETRAAAALIDRLVRRSLETNDLHEAEVLLGRLPAAVLEREPSLLLSLGWINLLRNDMELFSNTARAERSLEQIDPADPAYPEMEARLAVLKMAGAIVQRRIDELEGITQRAVRLESLLDERYKAMLWYLRFHQALHHSDWEQAELYGNRAIAAYTLANDAPGLISVRREMAVLSLHSGRAIRAARELDEVSAAYPPPQPNLVLRDMQYTLIQAAEAYYWLNDMERLRLRARAAAEMARQLGDTRASIIAGQLLDLHNLSKPDHPDLDYVRPRPLVLGEGGLFPFNTMFEVVYQMRQGKVGNALLIADALGFSATADPATVPKMRLPAYTLAYVAAGRELGALDAVMGYALRTLAEAKNLFLLGQMQAIEAWRQQKLGHRTAAIRALAAAVETSAQTGMLRQILDIPELAPLLDEVRHPRAAQLAALMDDDVSSAEGLGALTPGERRVLELLAQDLTYDDVAEKLSVSIHTVRTHVRRIYSKLGVNRRLGAVEMARQAGLIE